MVNPEIKPNDWTCWGCVGCVGCAAGVFIGLASVITGAATAK